MLNEHPWQRATLGKEVQSEYEEEEDFWELWLEKYILQDDF